MSRLFEASKSLTAIEQDSAIIAVIEIRRGGFCSSCSRCRARVLCADGELCFNYVNESA